MLKYGRIKLLQAALRPVQGYFRKKRMASFSSFLESLGSDCPRILDLGGQPGIWEFVDRPLSVVILNLPGVAQRQHSGRHDVRFVEGDACDLAAYRQGEFDVVFSNSVIEHVGARDKIERFCREAMRVGRKLWIQTPSRYFPIEPHTGMPFWWWYPAPLKRYFLTRWQRKLPAWTEMVMTTGYVDKADLAELLPGCELRVERFLGLPKSYIAIR